MSDAFRIFKNLGSITTTFMAVGRCVIVDVPPTLRGWNSDAAAVGATGGTSSA